MSSEGVVTGEVGQARGLVPKLRFPEFRDAGAWKEAKLDAVAPFQRGFDLTSDQIESGNVPVVYSNGIQRHHNIGMACGPGLITGRSGTIGKIHFIESGPYWPHNTSLWVTSFEGNVPKFVYYLYSAIGMTQFASGSGIPTLNRNHVHEFSGYLPADLNEQQKIADCLSSLDRLIAAEGDRLAALKAHKKGLMQQLFPAPNETTPRLRFPEFRDAGDWEERTLSQISPSIFDGTHQTPAYVNEGVPFYSVENLVSGNKNKFISQADHNLATAKNRPERGDILITRIGKIGFSQVIDWVGDFSIYVTLAVVKKSGAFNSAYLHAFFQSSRYQNELAQRSLLNAVPCKINMEELRKSVVLLPTIPEQDRIADLFHDGDSRIKAQIEKLEALKAHKSGLMQQLFPSPAEAGA
jgi:type I restriction enzyme, S subunit